MAEPRKGLPKSCRILASSGYTNVLRAGKKNNDALFSVYCTANGLSLARLGITVSRKVSPKAVLRNRIKRQVRESFRDHRNTLPGVDLIVIARSSAAGMAGRILRESLQHHWEKIRQQCRSS